jgi:hypothetical protein
MAEFPLEEYFRLMTSTDRTEIDNTPLPETNVSEQVVYIGTIPIPKSFSKSEVTETFPNSWEDFCREHMHSEEERWIDHRCKIRRIVDEMTPPWERSRDINESKMCLPNEQYAESFIALAQLIMLNEKFVTSDRKNRRFSIMVKRIFLNTTKDMTTDELEPYVVENYNLLLTDFHTLMFDTKEQAEEFIGKFDSIIRIAALSNLIG